MQELTYQVNTEPNSARTQLKHEGLNKAINRLSNLASQAQNLLDKIQGSRQSEDAAETPVAEKPTLITVLNTGAARVDEQSESVSKTLSSIESALFGA